MELEPLEIETTQKIKFFSVVSSMIPILVTDTVSQSAVPIVKRTEVTGTNRGTH